jgi:hypothetical protein
MRYDEPRLVWTSLPISERKGKGYSLGFCVKGGSRHNRHHCSTDGRGVFGNPSAHAENMTRKR